MMDGTVICIFLSTFAEFRGSKLSRGGEGDAGWLFYLSFFMQALERDLWVVLLYFHTSN